MTCQEFETVRCDLTRDLPLEAATRERARAHTQTCARCAQQLENERVLWNGLRALAAQDAALQASDRVEAQLRAAFREPAKAPTAPPLDFARVQSPTPFISRLVKAGLAAAAALILITMVALALRNSREPQQTARDHSEEGGQEVAVDSDNPKKELQPQSPTDVEKPLPQPDKPKRQPSVGLQASKRNRPQPATSNREISTSFIPLMGTDDLLQLDAGQLVRVKMARSALLSFGLPVNMERASEPITADLLIGNDGLARAIRFVQ